MNSVLKSMFFIFIVPGICLVAIIALLIFTDKERIFSSIPKDYNSLIKTQETIEQQYLNYGSYKINNSGISKKFKSDEKYKNVLENLYYPKSLLTSTTTNDFPIIILVTNAFFDTDIKLICEHIVSWGFVVLTVKDKNPSSYSITKLHEYLDDLNEKESINFSENEFKQKFNVNNIGIIGFDEALDAIYNTIKYSNINDKIKTIISLSPKFSEDSNIKELKIDIPSMVMIPSNNTDFTIRDQRKLSNTIVGEKVIARRKNADYQDMIYISTGYVVAWLRYIFYSKKDKTENDFFSELEKNELYKNCDIYIKDRNY